MKFERKGKEKQRKQKQKEKKKKKSPPSRTKEKEKEVSSLKASVPSKEVVHKSHLSLKNYIKKTLLLEQPLYLLVSKRHSLPLVMNLSHYLKRSKHFCKNLMTYSPKRFQVDLHL
uniref:Uncharacterized protein n=1 Tax=Cajanus cajan TaxID=3821 RepID=A0A151QQP0_CAJCA|nr:hypothetical protein KK1_046685 [Cajanus cajan]